MAEQNPLVNVGDTVTIKLPREANGTVTLACLGGASPVGSSVVLELSMDDGVTYEVVTMTRVDKSAPTSLTNTQSGWVEAPGYMFARARLTAITSGTQGVKLEWRKG